MAEPPPLALRKTALSFITAQSQNRSLLSSIDSASLRRLATPTYSHTFGPPNVVAQTPHLQGVFTMDAFLEHLGAMTARLRTWEVEVRRCVVDEREGSVVVLMRYGMFVEGEEEAVQIEVVWWLDLERGGEGEGEGEWRVRRSLEIVDPVAAGRVRELIMGAKEGRKDLAAVGEGESG